MTALRSQKYLAGSRDAPCTLRIVGVCTGDAETVVPAHIRDRHTGRGIKASDLSVADACLACHTKFDGQNGEPLSREDWLFYALRGLQETLERRCEIGLIQIPSDTPKSRKRAKIQQRVKAWTGRRKIVGRNSTSPGLRGQVFHGHEPASG